MQKSWKKKTNKKNLFRASKRENDDDSESDETEDEDGENLGSEIDFKIIQTINKIRNKNPDIYDQNATFFEKNGASLSNNLGDSTFSSKKLKSDAENKQLKYKDMIRKQIMASEKVEDILESENSDVEANMRHVHTQRVKDLAYDQEQKNIRKAVLSSMKNISDESSSDNENFLKIRELKIVTENNENDLIKAEMKNFGAKDKTDLFLKDYIENQRWKSNEIIDIPLDKINSAEQTGFEGLAADDSEDEKEVEKQDLFEAKYNFRFEEANGDKIITHSRNVPGSMRRKDETRKNKRELRKQRKDLEKKNKELEIRRLKNLKKEEIQRRLKEIEETSGGAVIDEETLNDDFDPEKWDDHMQKMFGEGYYDENDDALYENSFYSTNNDENEIEENNMENNEPSETEIDLNKKKLFEELHELDFEDMIEDMPCRFKYKQVKKEDFGLSVEDILLADDKDLNRCVPFKKIAVPYTDKEIKVKQKDLKDLRKSVKLAYETEQTERINAMNPSKKRKMAQKLKARENKDKNMQKNDSLNGRKDKKSRMKSQAAKSKKYSAKKEKNEKMAKSAGAHSQIDGSRLKSYGLI